MGHLEVVSWEDITQKFVEKIAVYVNGSSKIENNDSLYLSLSIILNVMSRWFVFLENFNLAKQVTSTFKYF